VYDLIVNTTFFIENFVLYLNFIITATLPQSKSGFICEKDLCPVSSCPSKETSGPPKALLSVSGGQYETFAWPSASYPAFSLICLLQTGRKSGAHEYRQPLGMSELPFVVCPSGGLNRWFKRMNTSWDGVTTLLFGARGRSRTFPVAAYLRRSCHTDVTFLLKILATYNKSTLHMNCWTHDT